MGSIRRIAVWATVLALGSVGACAKSPAAFAQYEQFTQSGVPITTMAMVRSAGVMQCGDQSAVACANYVQAPAVKKGCRYSDRYVNATCRLLPGKLQNMTLASEAFVVAKLNFFCTGGSDFQIRQISFTVDFTSQKFCKTSSSDGGTGSAGINVNYSTRLQAAMRVSSNLMLNFFPELNVPDDCQDLPPVEVKATSMRTTIRFQSLTGPQQRLDVMAMGKNGPYRVTIADCLGHRHLVKWLTGSGAARPLV